MALLDLMVKLGLNSTAFHTGFKQAEGSVNQFASFVKGKFAAAFGAAAIGGFIASVFQRADYLRQMSEQFGESAEDIQRLEKAARKTGLELENFTSVWRGLEAARKKAGEGNKETQELLAKYGVTMRDVQNPAMTTMNILERIASAMKNMRLTPESRSDMAELFGRLGGRAISALGRLPEQEASMSDSDVSNMSQMAQDVKSASKGIKGTVAHWIGALMEIGKRRAKGWEMFEGMPFGTRMLTSLKYAYSDEPIADELSKFGAEPLPKGDMYKDLVKAAREKKEKEAADKLEDRIRRIQVNDRAKLGTGDPLARIGNLMFGASGSEMTKLLRDQLQVQKNIERNTKVSQITDQVEVP
jgi:hypothetical protein